MSDKDLTTRIAGDPRYRRLVRRRDRFAWTLSAVVLATYFGFILLVAFDRELLAAPVGGGVTSIGIPLGLGVILLSIALTGIYVRRANHVFDVELAEIVAEHGA